MLLYLAKLLVSVLKSGRHSYEMWPVRRRTPGGAGKGKGEGDAKKHPNEGLRTLKRCILTSKASGTCSESNVSL